MFSHIRNITNKQTKIREMQIFNTEINSQYKHTNKMSDAWDEPSSKPATESSEPKVFLFYF